MQNFFRIFTVVIALGAMVQSFVSFADSGKAEHSTSKSDPGSRDPGV